MSTVVISKETVYPLHVGEQLIGKFTIEELNDIRREIDVMFQQAKDESTLIDRIVNNVCFEFNISRHDLLGRRRFRHVAYPRQIAMSLASELSKSNLCQIGRWFGKDHTTVVYAKQLVATRERDCVAEARVIDRIRQAIKTAIKAEEKPETNGHGI